jgi:hypothetical protein
LDSYREFDHLEEGSGQEYIPPESDPQSSPNHSADTLCTFHVFKTNEVCVRPSGAPELVISMGASFEMKPDCPDDHKTGGMETKDGYNMEYVTLYVNHLCPRGLRGDSSLQSLSD